MGLNMLQGSPRHGGFQNGDCLGNRNGLNLKIMGISYFSSCAQHKNISSAIFIAVCEYKLKNDLLEILNWKSHGNSWS